MAIKIDFKVLALAIAVCSLVPMGAASASGPKYAVHHLAEPAVSPDMGRIYFYRISGLLGFALQPAIKIDGVKVGDSVTSRYFYVDRPPGTYTISTTTEKEETVSVPLAAGQTVYVRFEVSMGLFVGHVSPEIVDNDKAADEIKDCHFVGTDTPATTATTTTPAPGTATTSAAPATATAPAATATVPPTAAETTQTAPTPVTSPTSAPGSTMTASPPAAPITATAAPTTAQPGQTTPQN